LFPINPTKEISGTVPATPEMIQNFWDNTEEERKMLPRSPALGFILRRWVMSLFFRH